MESGEPKIEEGKHEAETSQQIADKKVEVGDFPEAMSDGDIERLNIKRAKADLPPLRRATPEEREELDIAHRAVEAGRGGKYRSAIKVENVGIFFGSGHMEAANKAAKLNKQGYRTIHGWVDKDDNFLTLLDVARQEMKNKDK